jgi:hypothetical protein
MLAPVTGEAQAASVNAIRTMRAGVRQAMAVASGCRVSLSDSPPAVNAAPARLREPPTHADDVHDGPSSPNTSDHHARVL